MFDDWIICFGIDLIWIVCWIKGEIEREIWKYFQSIVYFGALFHILLVTQLRIWSKRLYLSAEKYVSAISLCRCCPSIDHIFRVIWKQMFRFSSICSFCSINSCSDVANNLVPEIWPNMVENSDRKVRTCAQLKILLSTFFMTRSNSEYIFKKWLCPRKYFPLKFIVNVCNNCA